MKQFTLLASTAIAAAAITVVVYGELPEFTKELLLEAIFAYGAGGTATVALVETSLDDVNWTGIASFDFATTAARKLANLSALTPITTIYAGTTALSANTVKDGILGKYIRVTLTTTGTYTGATTIAINAIARG